MIDAASIATDEPQGGMVDVVPGVPNIGKGCILIVRFERARKHDRDAFVGKWVPPPTRETPGGRVKRLS